MKKKLEVFLRDMWLRCHLIWRKRIVATTNLRDGSRVLKKAEDIGIVVQVSFDGGLFGASNGEEEESSKLGNLLVFTSYLHICPCVCWDTCFEILEYKISMWFWSGNPINELCVYEYCLCVISSISKNVIVKT